MKPIINYQFLDKKSGRIIETSSTSEQAARCKIRRLGKKLGKTYGQLLFAASSGKPFRGEYSNCEAGH